MKIFVYTLVVILLCFGVNSAEAAGKVAIIANKSLSEEAFNKSKLVDIFTLNKQVWDSGIKVLICEQKGDNTVKDLFYDYLGFNYSEIQKIWIKKQFSGKAMPPKSYVSDSEVLKKVASTPGAIGYIPYEMVTKDVIVIKTF